MLILNKNILTIGGNRLEGGPLTPPEPPTPPGPSFDEVTIGTQTWMAKDLAIDDGQSGITVTDWDYGSGNVPVYSYDYNAAARIANSIPGWHLPTKDEWETLINYCGGSSSAALQLKATYGWPSSAGGNGYDTRGFTALPNVEDPYYDSVLGAYWTSTISSGTDNYYWIQIESKIQALPDAASSWPNSVRLIKDT